MKFYLEKITIPAGRNFLVRRFDEARFSSPYHFHPEIELTYILKSSGTRIIGDHVGPFFPGDLCLIGENLPHVYRNEEHPKHDPAVSLVLQFNRGLAGGVLDASRELSGLSRLLDRARLGLVFPASISGIVGPLLLRMEGASAMRQWALFFEIMTHLVEAAPVHALSSAGYAGNTDGTQSERIRCACDQVMNHFQENLSHAEVAARCHMSPAHFSRVFKRATRKTFTEFLNEIRLGHASRLLAESERSVLEIAHASGFNNLSNFNRRFREAHGCSPREWRRQILLNSGHSFPERFL